MKLSKVLSRKNCIMMAVSLISLNGSAAISSKSSAHKAAIKSPQKIESLSITQLGGSEHLPKPSRPEIDLFENMNQCAGTVQHYRLPPTGYVPAAVSKESLAGKQLYQRLDCASCHKIKGNGGTLGPPLDGIGGARGEQFITAHLLDPDKQMQEFPDLFGGRPNLMPHPGVSLVDAKSIAAYLLTLPEPKNGFLISSHPKVHNSSIKKTKRLTTQEPAGSIEPGRKLFLSHGCAACHTLNNQVPRFGPRLDGISSRRTRLQLEEAMHGGTDEPEMNFKVYHLTNQEAKQIVDFLIKLPRAR